ncbi:MAG: Hpt domain-containing protein [Deltaproteobacteria bacterium]|nr:Hpt domain-containing protein [Deltaproteobacteria bacterium]
MTPTSDRSSTNSIALDPAALASLGDLLDHDVVAWDELVNTQIANGARLADEVRRALASADWELLGRASHTLKSSSALFGARDLAHTCQQVEAAVHRRETTHLAGQVEELLALFALTDRALRQLLGNVP